MRREFILVLLGIISISTISSFLSGYVQLESDKILLDTVVGAVGCGNFSYWQLGHAGPLLVELTSLSGDADLYISDNPRPSYEIDRNNFSSATCGSDMVPIPSDFPRPIGIGVFGYWSSAVSDYSIQVFLDVSQLEYSELPLSSPMNEKYADAESKSRKENSHSKRNEDDTKPRFLKLLSILDAVFEIFVL
ncbi:UPF0669 protein C6orf120 homolog [Eumeta japonica]|uniref:UPF0669 protein C6orf120 homolog n=1 Tax=Eumeta variegata TaxID=151549 RepID=A0A4C1UMX1_EUMVA|nr:UPF0669 protein C6orf120 homolog [Eumeta japonica]